MKTAMLTAVVGLFATSLFAGEASAQCVSTGFGYSCTGPILVLPQAVYYTPDWVLPPVYPLTNSYTPDNYWVHYEGTLYAPGS